MIYAVVTSFTDGHSNTEYINQKSLLCSKRDADLMGFEYKDIETGSRFLCIDYVKSIDKTNIMHPVEHGTIKICLNNVISVKVYNVDTTNNRYKLDTLVGVAYGVI